jgi:hypothetical protein
MNALNDMFQPLWFQAPEARGMAHGERLEPKTYLGRVGISHDGFTMPAEDLKSLSLGALGDFCPGLVPPAGRAARTYTGTCFNCKALYLGISPKKVKYE